MQNKWVIIRYIDQDNKVLEVFYELSPERTAKTFSSAKAAADYANKHIGSDSCFIAKLINPGNILDVQVHVIPK